MPDKSFEQQVREELSGLRIKPNDAVWQTVAASLQQKRKRRWAIWMITLLIGLSGAGFWLFFREQNDQKITATLQQPDTLQEKNDLPIKQKNSNQQDTINLIPLNSESVQTNAGRTVGKQHQVAEVVRISAKVADRPNDITEKKESVKVETNQNTSDIGLIKQQIIEPIASVPLKKDSIALIPKETKENESSENIEQPTREALKAMDSSITVNDTSGINTVIKKQQAKKWNWSGELVIGRSGIRNSLGSLFEGSSGAMYNNFLGSGIPTTSSPGSIPINLVRPKVQDHFSFGASVEMSKAIGKKQKNSLGIQIGYQLYQTKYRVGSANSGTLQFSNVNRANESNVYYGVRDSVNYIASYHFIRLGLQWYRSLNWLKKAELRWYAGMGTNIMLSGNGLHVGVANNSIYYFKNRSLLQTIQLDALTGLEIGIGKQKRLYVGPQLQYMLSNLSKQNGVNQHLYRPSIKMSLLLSKSKK